MTVDQITKKIQSFFPDATIMIVKGSNQYREYIEFRVITDNAALPEKVAEKWLKLHSEVYTSDLEYRINIVGRN